MNMAPRLIPALQLAIIYLSFNTEAWFKYKTELHCVYFQIIIIPIPQQQQKW